MRASKLPQNHENEYGFAKLKPPHATEAHAHLGESEARDECCHHNRELLSRSGSGETSTLATIAAHHNLPATCIQPPYKDMKWALYSDNFKRTLSRLQLYRLSLNRQNPDKATIHLRLMSESHPSSSHLQPIADWLDSGTLPPRPSLHTTP